MRRLFEWLGRLSDGLSLANLLGVPMSLLAGIGAAIWAVFANRDALSVTLILFVVSFLALWTWIGVLTLIDRAKQYSPHFIPADYDCSWALSVGEPCLSKDPHNDAAEYQFRLFMTNMSEFPVKYIVEKASVTLDNCVSPYDKNNYSPGVLARWGGRTRVNFNSFKRGQLPQSGTLAGTGAIQVRYGHPSIGYSRLMKKEFRVKCQLSPPWDLTKVIVMGILPAEIAPTMEEEESC